MRRAAMLTTLLALVASPAAAQRGMTVCDLLGMEASRQRARLDRGETLPRREAQASAGAYFTDGTLTRLDDYVAATRAAPPEALITRVRRACERDSPVSASHRAQFLSNLCSESMRYAAQGHTRRKEGMGENTAVDQALAFVRRGFEEDVEDAVRFGYRSGAASPQAAGTAWMRHCLLAAEIRFP